MERVGQAVRADPAVRRGRHLGRHVRRDRGGLVVIVRRRIGDELASVATLKDCRRGVISGHRVEMIDIAGRDPAQGAAGHRRARAARGVPAARGRFAGTARCQRSGSQYRHRRRRNPYSRASHSAYSSWPGRDCPRRPGHGIVSSGLLELSAFLGRVSRSSGKPLEMGTQPQSSCDLESLSRSRSLSLFPSRVTGRGPRPRRTRCLPGRPARTTAGRTPPAQRVSSRRRPGLRSTRSFATRHLKITVRRPWSRTRCSACQRTARASATRSASRPMAARSSGLSEWSTRATSCSMIGPSSRSAVT